MKLHHNEVNILVSLLPILYIHNHFTIIIMSIIIVTFFLEILVLVLLNYNHINYDVK